jgi:hypothetical protein
VHANPLFRQRFSPGAYAVLMNHCGSYRECFYRLSGAGIEEKKINKRPLILVLWFAMWVWFYYSFNARFVIMTATGMHWLKTASSIAI